MATRLDSRSDDVAKAPHAQKSLNDTSYSRRDHMRNGTGDLDTQEAGDTDQETKYASDGCANEESSKDLSAFDGHELHSRVLSARNDERGQQSR